MKTHKDKGICSLLELPYPPSVLNPNNKKHWAVKSAAAKKYRKQIGWIAKTHPPLKEFKLTFYPRRSDADRDNAIASFKAGQDGLQDAWGINDRDFIIHYQPLAKSVKGGKVIIEAV